MTGATILPPKPPPRIFITYTRSSCPVYAMTAQPRRWGVTSFSLNLRARWRCGQRHAPADLPPGRSETFIDIKLWQFPLLTKSILYYITSLWEQYFGCYTEGSCVVRRSLKELRSDKRAYRLCGRPAGQPALYHFGSTYTNLNIFLLFCLKSTVLVSMSISKY